MFPEQRDWVASYVLVTLWTVVITFSHVYGMLRIVDKLIVILLTDICVIIYRLNMHGMHISCIHI